MPRKNLKSTETSRRTGAERLKQASRERREQQKEGLRQAILDAAGKLFLEQGYEGFSLRQVAEQIGYSATTIYRYFENKDDLLFAIIHDGFTKFGRELAAAGKRESDPLERIQVMGRAYVNFGIRNPVHYQLMFMQRSDFLFEVRGDQKQPKIDSFNVLRDAVIEAAEAQALKQVDVETFSHALWAAVHGLTALAINGAAWFTTRHLKKSTDLTLRLLLDGAKLS